MADSRRLLISSAPFYSFLSRRSDASAIRAATARRNTSRFWTAIYGSLFVLSSLSFPTTRGSEAMTTVSRRRPLPSSFLQTAFKWPSGARGIANPSMPLRLNRLLFEPEEIYHGKDDETLCYAAIPPCDARTVHIKEILKAQDGDTIRVGVVNGGRNDSATVFWESDGYLKIDLGPAKTLLRPFTLDERPRVDLLLAMQAPIRMERMIPYVASMGIGRLIITSAKKVEKSYWGSHLLRETAAIHKLIKEGLAQAGDTIVPEVIIERRLKKFLEDDLEALYPSSASKNTLRVVAHPFREVPGSPAVPTRFRHVAKSHQPGPETTEPSLSSSSSSSSSSAAAAAAAAAARSKPRLLVAIGPESGWEEPYELDLFRKHGFKQVTMGARVLRTETAVPALLALAHDCLEAIDEEEDMDEIE